MTERLHPHPRHHLLQPPDAMSFDIIPHLNPSASSPPLFHTDPRSCCSICQIRQNIQAHRRKKRFGFRKADGCLFLNAIPVLTATKREFRHPLGGFLFQRCFHRKATYACLHGCLSIWWLWLCGVVVSIRSKTGNGMAFTIVPIPKASSAYCIIPPLTEQVSR